MCAVRFFTACIVVSMLAGCSTTVQPPASSLGQVHTEQMPQAQADAQQSSVELGSSDQTSMVTEMAIEREISEACLKAWRTGLKGDEKGAMAQLDALSKKYPNVGTIALMKAQVLDHFGHRDQAISFYRSAGTGKEFSTIRILKLADDLRKTKHDKEAVVEYRRLLSCQPDFVAGKIGLAKSLLDIDKSSVEAKKELQSALTLDPDNKEAKDLLNKIASK